MLTVEEKAKIEDDIESIEESIALKNGEKYAETVKDHVANICSIDGSFRNNKMWKLKQRVIPRLKDKPSAKKDTDGLLVTNPMLLKGLYLETYKDRLRHSEILPHLAKLKILREELFRRRLEKCKAEKSPDFTLNDLDKVLAKLKTGKACDANGFVNEMFKKKT